MNEKRMLKKSSMNYLPKVLSLEANKFMCLVFLESLLNRKADDFHNSQWKQIWEIYKDE